MKPLLIVLYLISTCIVSGQSNYDVDIKTENKAAKTFLEAKNKRENLGKCRFVYTFDFKEGDRFIFEKSETAIKEGWDMQWYFLTKEIKKDEYKRTKLSQKDYAGKIVKIIKIEEKKGIVSPDTYYTFEVEGTGEQISLPAMYSREYQRKEMENAFMNDQIYVLPYLLYIPEIDAFRDNFIDKTFYTKYIVGGKKFQPVKFTKVGAGHERAPIRVVFENAQGEQDYKDICTCGTNVPSSFMRLNYFENFFSGNDPKNEYKGDEETWDLITQGKIKIGMSEDNLKLSWGLPKKINETVVAGEVSKQFIYTDQYVYVANGKVISFQSSR